MAVLIVSDLHLDRAHPEITAHFLRFLNEQARTASALYVLGDLFEVWLGDDDTCAHKAKVTQAFADLSRDGVALYFMHGNRDFLLGADFCKRSGGQLIDDPTLIQTQGQRVLLTHGDALCTDDIPYQKLRALVRNPSLQRRFRALSLKTRDNLAGEARQGSKAHTATQAMALMDVNEQAVSQLFRRAQVDVMVHGHTHRPAVHPLVVDGIARTRIVLGDWHHRGSYLQLDGDGFELISLPRD